MIRSTGTASSGASYEPIDANDFDDQNDNDQYRGPHPSTYQQLEANDEDEDDHVLAHGAVKDNISSNPSHSQSQSPSWYKFDDRSDPRNENPFIRQVSREGSVLSHPTPDLQAIQGAYIKNVEFLEQQADRLSMSSNIDEELRKLHMEQKRADSRRSSVMAASRQFSSSSHTNSILGLNSVARSGGFSHEGYVTSPISSIRSPAWSQHDQLSQRDQMANREPLQEGKPLDSPISVRSNILTVRNQDQEEEDTQHSMNYANHSLDQAIEEHGQYSEFVENGDGKGFSFAAHDDEVTLHRNASTATKNTYQQAQDAFADFDGVHIPSEHDIASPIAELEEPLAGEEPIDRQMSFSPNFSGSAYSHSQGQCQGQSQVQSPIDNGMVFYPAPVPMMLNLPQKLSKNATAAKMAQRRSQYLNGPKRKSTATLLDMPGSPIAEEEERKLPPQLRATMYFDQPSVSQNIEVTGGSAVATLDSILDASAYAPVSAFTDHPIVGHVGSNAVYGQEKEARKPLQRRSQSTTDVALSDQQAETDNRRSFLGFGRRNKSKSTQLSSINLVKETDEAEEKGEESPLRASFEDERDEAINAQEEQMEEEVRMERPTTLLAELQIRKQEQQKRGRTAVSAFPDGMRTTLLELDAVAQVQRKARKQKQVTLAWEDPAAADDPEPDETEDVPLGMLYPTRKLNPKSGNFDEDRPLGLLAKRTMEDNEPLSARRARLRGDQHPMAQAQQSQFFQPPPPDMDGKPQEDEDEEAGETLAQRRQRLAIKQAVPKPRPVSGDFASELLSQFDPEPKAAPLSVTPDPEETLGQRKKRLQAEAAQRQASGASGETPVPQKRRSMADLLAAHPVGQRSTSGESGPSRGLLAQVNRQSMVSPTQNIRHSQAQMQAQNYNLAPGYYKPNAMPYGQRMGLAGQAGGQTQMQPGMGYVNPMTYTPMRGVNGGGLGMPGYQQMGTALDHTPLNDGQRDVIDRWRQSVM